MLKWSGDFTVPRFRAKLANKYQLHPCVEAGYEEVYRPELGETTIVQKGFNFGSSMSLKGGQRSKMGGSTSATDLRLGRSTSGFQAGGRLAMDKSRLGSTWSSGMMSKSASTPTIGLRRTEVAPATAPPRKPLLALTSDLSDDRRRELQAEKKMETASRDLWAAAPGSEMYIKEQLQILLEPGEELHGKSLALPASLTIISRTPVPAMQRAMKSGAQVDWQSEEWDGATLLLKAVRTGALEMVMYLISVKADPVKVDRSWRGVLHWAALEGNAPMMEYLLKYVIMNVPTHNLNEADKGGDSPMHLAAYHGHLPVVRLLVRAGAEPGQKNAGGFTPLELAEATRSWHVASYLNDYREQKQDKEAGIPRADQKKPDGEKMPESVVNHLERSCNLARANEYRVELASMPKPKAKKAAGKKK